MKELSIRLSKEDSTQPKIKLILIEGDLYMCAQFEVSEVKSLQHEIQRNLFYYLSITHHLYTPSPTCMSISHDSCLVMFHSLCVQ